jgi:hypothetical protein
MIKQFSDDLYFTRLCDNTIVYIERLEWDWEIYTDCHDTKEIGKYVGNNFPSLDKAKQAALDFAEMYELYFGD